MCRVSSAISLTTFSFSAEADDFDVEVVVGEGELFAEGDEGLAVFEQDAQDVGELDDHAAGEFGLGADEGGDGVEGVEEEVGVDLALEGVETGFEEESSLLFEFCWMRIAFQILRGMPTTMGAVAQMASSTHQTSELARRRARVEAGEQMLVPNCKAAMRTRRRIWRSSWGRRRLRVTQR